MIWYIKAFKHYADFTGRARRMEYWMFGLFNFLFGAILLTVDWILIEEVSSISFSPFFVIYYLISFIPSISVAVRRLHDVGKSGWMLLISLIPIIGSIWLLILLFTDSEFDSNEYGQNPKNNTNKKKIKSEFNEDFQKEEVFNNEDINFNESNDNVTNNINSRQGNEKTKVNSIVITIVISLISFILVSILILYFIRESISKSRTKKEIVEIERILEKRKKELGFYPKELNEIIGINPMRKNIDIDFWKNEYYYKLIDNEQNYILISKGKDGILGTSDDIGNNIYKDVVENEPPNNDTSKVVEVEIIRNEDGTVTATVITKTYKNGETRVAKEIFEGTEEEVNSLLDNLK